jgi:hypothetical protein
MSKRRFRMVGVSVWKSRRFRALPSEGCRFAYIYALTNRHTTNIGLYELPPEYMASDLSIPVEDAEQRLIALSSSGLIRYDWDENLLALDNWFEFNAIDSRKHLAGALTSLDEYSQTSPLTTHTLLLIASSMIERATGWSADEKGREARIDAFGMLNHAVNDHRATIGLETFERVYFALPEIHRKRLHFALAVGLPEPHSIPLSNGKTTIDTERETETEKERETENKIAAAGPNSDVVLIKEAMQDLERKRAAQDRKP